MRKLTLGKHAPVKEVNFNLWFPKCCHGLWNSRVSAIGGVDDRTRNSILPEASLHTAVMASA